MQMSTKTALFYGVALGTMVTIVTICCVQDRVRGISRYITDCADLSRKTIRDSPQQEDEFEMTSEQFQKRRLHLQQYCKNSGASHVGRLANHVGDKADRGVASQLIYDDRHDLVFCAVPKVGSSFWKRVLQIARGDSVATSPFDLDSVKVHQSDVTMARYSRQKLREILSGATTLLFARHPLGRLYSAFVDKVFLPTFQTRRLGRNIVRLVRTRPSAMSWHCAHNVTFAETVFYVILTLEKRHQNWDPHFVPIYYHCRPCSIDYDYVGKMESFARDTRFLLEKTNLTSMLAELDQLEKDSDVNIIKDLARRTFSVLQDHLDCYSRHEIFLRLWRTYHLRGLLSDDKEFPLSPEESDVITLREFQQVAKKAYAESKPRDYRIQQRKRAVTHAYKGVPKWHLKRLQKIYQADCDLFGYDCDVSSIDT